MKAMDVLLRPWELITDPVFYGTERLPESGHALFVGTTRSSGCSTYRC
jgi:hypothetical protein